MRFLEPSEVNDLNQVATLGQEFAVRMEHQYVFLPEEFCRLWKAFLDTKMGFILVSTIAGEIREAIGGMTFSDPHDGVKCGMVGFWYYGDGPRGLQSGRLFQSFERKMVELEVRRLFAQALLNSRFPAVSHFLGGVGFRPVEMNFVKDI